MPFALSAKNKKLLVQLAIAGVVLLVAAGFALRGFDVRGLADRWGSRGMGLLRDGGPWVFFIAMALLPAVGAPLMAFSLTAGTAFGDRMGMAGVLAAGFTAIAVNMFLTYWLARRAFRPWIARLVVRLGYTLPQLDKADMTDLIVLVRVTPGPPFFAQNYLLGLADAPFASYMAISCIVMWSYSGAAMIFGQALLSGRGKVAVISIMAFVALVAASHLVRHHWGKRKQPV